MAVTYARRRTPHDRISGCTQPTGPFGSSGFKTARFRNWECEIGVTLPSHIPFTAATSFSNNFAHLRLAIMGSTASQKARAVQTSLNSKKKHKKRFMALMAATAAAVITRHSAPSLFPTPMNTSVLTGMEWLRELLTGHPVRFYDALAMPKHVFHKLVHELELHAGHPIHVLSHAA